MTYPPDPVTHHKLTLVKSLYRHAVSQSEGQHSMLVRMLAVSTFDLAIETALKTVIRALDPSTTPRSDLNSLIQVCDNALKRHSIDPVPDQANINQVRSYRNAVQHEARYPNESEINDCRTYTRDFLEKLVPQVWGMSLDQIRQGDLIRHDEVRNFLNSAEEAFLRGDYQEAVKQASAALDRALLRVRRAVVGPSFSTFVAKIPVKSVFDKPVELEEETAPKAISRMQDTLLYIALGMSYDRYLRFRRIAGSTTFSYSHPHPSHMGNEEKNVSPGSAEFALSYAVEAALEIEDRVGDIDDPFGLNTRRYYLSRDH